MSHQSTDLSLSDAPGGDTRHVRSASVDTREVAYYDRFAQTWWDPQGPFWPLHRLNALRADWLRGHMAQHFGRTPNAPRPLAGLRLLDVGCGGGILSESMAALGAEVHGIDVVERNLQVARAHAERSGRDVAYELATVEAVAERGQAYDAVLNMEVVEHVADLEGFLAASCALVRPGGMMFVATINRTALAWLVAIVGAEYVLRWMPRGTHRWDWFRKPSEIERLLRGHGVEPSRSTGVFVNPFRKSLHLVRSRQVNWMMSAVKPAPGDGGEAG